MATKPDKPLKLTAKEFLARLKAQGSAAEAEKTLRYFKSGEGEYGEGDKFIGVRMGQVFALAKEFSEMPLDEIEKLLDSPIHEARAGALSIMGIHGRRKKTPDALRKQLFDFYMRRHDRVNNWDLVDLGALYIVGTYLINHPRDVLYKLARSKNIWERRTAIVGTGPLIRNGETADTFKIAEMLVNDKEDLIHKGTGWMLRTAGDVHREKLLEVPGQTCRHDAAHRLRYALEKFEKKATRALHESGS